LRVSVCCHGAGATARPLFFETMTIEKLKKQLNIGAEFTGDDALFTDLLAVATVAISDIINADIAEVERTVEHNGEVAFYPYAPVKSVTGTKAGAETAVTITKMWEGVKVESDADTLVIKSGYGENIPEPLQHAILMKAAALYDTERTDQIIGVSVAQMGVIEALVRPYKRKYW
jgi:hypothetical protein